MKKKITTAILFLLAITFCEAQISPTPQLKAALQNKNTFGDIMKTVTDYFVANNYKTDRKLFSQFKKWSRWGWYMGNHLDSTGQAVNISEQTWQAYQQTWHRETSLLLNLPILPCLIREPGRPLAPTQLRKEQGGLTGWHFIQPTKTLFMQAHQPEAFGAPPMEV